PEVDHIERADRDDPWDAGRAGGGQPVRPRGEHTANQLVTELGRRDVELPGEQPLPGQRLQRAAADTGHMEDQYLVAELLQLLPTGGDAWRRDAEHARCDHGLLIARRQRRRLHHARDGRGSVRENWGGDTVHAGDVNDARGEDEVSFADVRLRI